MSNANYNLYNSDFTNIYEKPWKIMHGHLILRGGYADVFLKSELMPNSSFDEYWEHIFLPKGVKEKLLNYLLLVFRLSQGEFSHVQLPLHKILLIYGPPGTGKTTFARGLANKFASEIKSRFKFNGNIIYLELNPSYILSKYLGESPKLVNKAFDLIENMAKDASNFILCLFDEVESILIKRSYTLSESNPVDVFRSVNTVLERLDALLEKKNVILLSTSNLVSALDNAFLDRIDMQIKFDLPSENIRRKIIIDTINYLNNTLGCRLSVERNKKLLEKLVRASESLSGRKIRKIISNIFISDINLIEHPEKLCFERLVNFFITEKRNIANE